MKKLIALLAVLGMMFSSFAYAGNAVTEESIVSNHTQEIAQFETAVKNLANVFGETTTGKKLVESLKAQMLPLSLPEMTPAEQNELSKAEERYQKVLENLIDSLTEEENTFFVNTTQQQLKRSADHEVIEAMSEEEQTVLFTMISLQHLTTILLKNCNLSDDEKFAFIVYGQWKLIEEMKQ